MKKKSIISVVLCFLMFILVNPYTSLAAEGSEGGHWVQGTQGRQYQNVDSTYTVDQWQLIEGNWYLFDSNGYALTGWQQLGTSWYYMDSSGIMQTGWVLDNNIWYYLSESGIMQTGWVKWDSGWYYMNLSGAMQTGWVKTGGNWYWITDNGKMTLGNKTFDGSVYKFDTSGALSSISIDPDAESGEYFVAVYNDNEQALLDYINQKRGSSKSVVSDQTLNTAAEYRLNGALTYGYYAKGKTITGMGTLKDYLKTINYKYNRTTKEFYIRAAADVDALIDSLENNYDGTVSLTSYSNVGISVTEKNDKLYAMVIYMK